MTDHQPMPVGGYTTQSQSNIDLANEGKELEERYLRWLSKLADLNGTHTPGQTNLPIDPRCLAKARTCIQTGAMWAIRSIFKPQRIALPEDQP